MKKLLPLALVLLTTSFVEGQETYQAPADAAQQIIMTAMVDRSNAGTCLRLGLTVGCVQSLACTTVVPPAAGGASCTPAQARNAGVRIWPQTFAGREEFFQQRIALVKFNEMTAELVNLNQAQQKRTWDTGNQTVKNTMCTDAGLSANCLLYLP